MGDYKSHPAWKRGMSLAHSLYATVEEAGLKDSDEGRRLRKAAVSVPSLIAEACIDAGRDPEEAIFLANSRLEEVARLLSGDPFRVIPENDRVALLSEVGLLGEDLINLKQPCVEN